MTRADVVAEARKWLGVRYRNKGRTTDGLDCIGLLVVVGRGFGITSYADDLNYSNWPAQDHLILRELTKHLTFLPPASVKPGLIGVFAETRLPGHVGIFSEKHRQVHLIHARMTIGANKVIEEPWQQMPRRELRLIALFGLPGLEL